MDISKKNKIVFANNPLKQIRNIVLLSLLTLCIGCSSIETKDAKKAYAYWAGGEPPSNIKLIKGEYYQSPHFTLEYELFLKFKSDSIWFHEFVAYNKLEIDTVNHDWSGWTKLPKWFETNENYIIYSKNQTDQFERSRYFINPENGICYIYETVGM